MDLRSHEPLRLARDGRDRRDIGGVGPDRGVPDMRARDGAHTLILGGTCDRSSVTKPHQERYPGL